MAANLALANTCYTQFNTKLFQLSTQLGTVTISPNTRRKRSKSNIHAQLGGGEESNKAARKRKFITKEEEPEQYWQTAGEREGENPMKTPLPYIIIFGMSTPFVILAIAFANGWIKVPVR